MKFKRVITSGCSFSDSYCNWTWPHILERHVLKIDSSVTFDHRGLGHQGQELIQKKAIYSAIKALDEGYRPDEIAIVVMWSGHDRKSWYITNPDLINTIVSSWDTRGAAWHIQFSNIEGDHSKVVVKELSNVSKIPTMVKYIKEGGWYHSSWNPQEPEFIKEYFTFDQTIDSCASLSVLHNSLENMIMLQNFCRAYGITLYQQYYMDQVIHQLEKFKDDKLLSYLYKQLDNNCIKVGCYEFVGKVGLGVGVHPTAEGHQYWFDKMLHPFLDKKGFFNE